MPSMTRMDDAVPYQITFDNDQWETVKTAGSGWCDEIMFGQICAEVDRARAEEVRLRAALDAIGEGHAGSHYSALQEYARAALAGEPSS